MTFRAIRLLKEADIVLAEDTRTTKKLLVHYDINTPLRSFHQHNEHKVLEKIIDDLKAGTRVCLVSDAGTPGISDPGFLLVRECVREGIPVSTLPGPTAFVPALVNSGFPINEFVFEGFIPVKKGKQTKLKEIANESRTVVLYESPHRILKTIEKLSEYIGDRRICLSREISKIYEENVIGTCKEVLDHFSEKAPKGEIVLVIEALK
ncbi:MAG: 16S rRNA (cytidine(1402)-2'-O)-methyltransferase [Flavobacteriales bacterium]|nr:16S rRNA (cytidine(1402)-2'-O)-methyltransferase [Flavobacteriales bacterium]